jgi:hypothetical protein
MPTVPPNHEGLLRVAFCSPLLDGSCVLDADRHVGHVWLEFGTRRGPDSLYWDGWISATQARTAHSLRGSVVNLIGHAS